MQRQKLPVAVRPRGDGYAVGGPGFYVWQEDRPRTLGWARELSPLPVRELAHEKVRRARPQLPARRLPAR